MLVRIQGEANTNSLLFTPGCDDGAVTMVDAFIEGGSGGCVTLLVENHGNMPLILDAGLKLGTTMPIQYRGSGSRSSAMSGPRPGQPHRSSAVKELVCALGPNSTGEESGPDD